MVWQGLISKPVGVTAQEQRSEKDKVMSPSQPLGAAPACQDTGKDGEGTQREEGYILPRLLFNQPQKGKGRLTPQTSKARRCLKGCSNWGVTLQRELQNWQQSFVTLTLQNIKKTRMCQLFYKL